MEHVLSSVNHSSSDSSLNFRPPLADEPAQTTSHINTGSFLGSAGWEGAARLGSAISRGFARAADCLRRKPRATPQPDMGRRILVREDSVSQGAAPRASVGLNATLIERPIRSAMMAASRSSSSLSSSSSTASVSLSLSLSPPTVVRQESDAAASNASGGSAQRVAADKPGDETPEKEIPLPHSDWSI
jgi:hypothetical protein